MIKHLTGELKGKNSLWGSRLGRTWSGVAGTLYLGRIGGGRNIRQRRLFIHRK